MHPRESDFRPAVAAGSFFPADPVRLRRCVAQLLTGARAEPRPAVGAIVPHAGYAFSGSCAAAVYARVRIPGTVVIVGPNHYAAGRRPGEACVWSRGAFGTPLGSVSSDAPLAEALMQASPRVVRDLEAHALDHGLEVQLPFLIAAAGAGELTIVPVLLGWDDWTSCAELARALASVAATRIRHGVLLLASSDMTHFAPADVALRQDEWALAAIRRLDGAELMRVCRERDISMCGAAAAAVVVEASRHLGATRAEVVAHTHSGRVTGDRSSVVSYAGVVIT